MEYPDHLISTAIVDPFSSIVYPKLVQEKDQVLTRYFTSVRFDHFLWRFTIFSRNLVLKALLHACVGLCTCFWSICWLDLVGQWSKAIFCSWRWKCRCLLIMYLLVVHIIASLWFELLLREFFPTCIGQKLESREPCISLSNQKSFFVYIQKWKVLCKLLMQMRE